MIILTPPPPPSPKKRKKYNVVEDCIVSSDFVCWIKLFFLINFKYNVSMLIFENKTHLYHTIVMFIFLSLHKSINILQKSWSCYKIVCKILAGKKKTLTYRNNISVDFKINCSTPVALFTKIRNYSLNFLTLDYLTTIPKSFSQELSYSKF